MDHCSRIAVIPHGVPVRIIANERTSLEAMDSFKRVASPIRNIRRRDTHDINSHESLKHPVLMSNGLLHQGKGLEYTIKVQLGDDVTSIAIALWNLY